MPAAQLFTGGLEKAINHLISLDPDAAENLSVLAGKRLRVTIKELPWPLVFAFSDQVDVLAAEDEGHKDQADCSLRLSLATMESLQNPSLITKLIKQDKLTLDGDIHVAQGFSNLIKQLNIDWEEQLSRYTGDVLAHSVFSFGKSAMAKAKEKADALLTTLAEGALEEKKLAAHPIAVVDFCDQVQALRADTDRLEARLNALSKTSQGKHETAHENKINQDSD